MSPLSERHYQPGLLLAEGKTKKVSAVSGEPGLAWIHHKIDITAGDGKKHDRIRGKDVHCNTTNAAVFGLLNACGLPTAFVKKVSKTSFVAHRCTMLPYEVVVRREGVGSWSERNPHRPKNELFPRLVVEVYLKTKDRKWKRYELVCDDPYLLYDRGLKLVHLYDAHRPIEAPFLTLREDEVFSQRDESMLLPQVHDLARMGFLILEAAWRSEGGRLIDIKFEFGINPAGHLVFADDVTNDSWRVMIGSEDVSKQRYREGENLVTVKGLYKRVADITSRFQLPSCQIVLCEGKNAAFSESFELELSLCTRSVTVISRTRKDGNGVVDQKHLERTADHTVVVLAPDVLPDLVMWALSTTFPIVRATDPATAARDALRVFALSNPLFYARMRGELEEVFSMTH